MSFKKGIPNFITSLNLLCGVIAIIMAFHETYIQYAPFLVFGAAIFDFFDGFAARLLKAYSELGKQLDSLADAISFGVAPGIIGFQLMLKALGIEIDSINASNVLFLITPLLVCIFSALRLAKFNIDERQTTEFYGLPTPASAMLIVSLALIVFWGSNEGVKNFILSPWLLAVLFIADSIIMVSDIRLFSLKFKTASFSDNTVKYIFIAVSGLLIVFIQYYAIPLIIILYVLTSIVVNLTGKKA